MHAVRRGSRARVGACRVAAVRFVKTEVFDYGLRQQGCSGVELQQTLARAGFRLYAKDPAEHPAEPPLNPAVLLPTLQGNPYNLYCVQGQPYPRFADLRRMRAGRDV